MSQPSEMAAMDAETDTQKRKTLMTPSSPETDENPSQIPRRSINLRRRNSLPDIKSVQDFDIPENLKVPVQTESQGQSFYLHEMVYRTMCTPSFISAIAPLLAPTLCAALKPEIERTINATIQSAVERTIAPLIATIESQRVEIAQQKSHIANLEQAVGDLYKRTEELEIQQEEQEQYSRRTCLRFHNISPDATDTDEAVIKICKENLGVTLTKDDIGRSHFVGRANVKGNRQVIVRFLSYRTRAHVFRNKKKLKGHPGKVFLTEDLTLYRRRLVNTLIDLQKNHVISSFWTNDGRIFAKKSDGSSKVMITSQRDIDLLR